MQNKLIRMEETQFNLIELKKKGKICILKLNRPDRKNAMSEAMRTEILEALEMIKDVQKIRTVIFYGGEEFFCSGFDKDEVQAAVQGEGDVQRFIDSNLLFHERLLKYPKLMIAAINGYALAGGFDLSVLCHLRVAAKDAVFGHPEIRFGACPLFFPYMMLCGRGKALELTLNAGTRETFIDAQEAHRLNIVNKLVEPGEALNEAINMAKEINKSPAIAVTQLLQVSNAFLDRYKAFETEVNTIVESMKKMLNL